MVYAFPTNETLWNRYAEMYRGNRSPKTRCGEEATALLPAKPARNGRGAAEVYRPERYNPDEISTISTP